MSAIRAADLPAYRTWLRSTAPGRPRSAYLENEIPLLAAMTVMELIFPRLIEVRGCVVRADKHDQTNFDGWWNALDGDRERVEFMVNLLSTRSYFEPNDHHDEREKAIEERALEVLADQIAFGWRTQAAITFPDRTIEVKVVEGNEDEGPTVTLYTRPDFDRGAASYAASHA